MNGGYLYCLQVLCNHLRLSLPENHLLRMRVGNGLFQSYSPQQPAEVCHHLSHDHDSVLSRSSHNPVVLAGHVTDFECAGRSMSGCVLLLLVLSQPQIYDSHCRLRHSSAWDHMSAQRDASLRIDPPTLKLTLIQCVTENNILMKLLHYGNPVSISIFRYVFHMVGGILTHYSFIIYFSSQCLKCSVLCGLGTFLLKWHIILLYTSLNLFI